MAKKRITIQVIRDRVEAMSDKVIARCYFMYERTWGEFTYWIIFTEPDLRGERVSFKSVQAVSDWLDSFEAREGRG